MVMASSGWVRLATLGRDSSGYEEEEKLVRFQGLTGRVVAISSVAVVLALGASGCGDDDDTANANGAGSGTSAAEQLSGPPVRTMSLASVKYQGQSYESVHEVAKAYEKYVNANGGIGGRPLEVITCDDRGDPNQVQVCAREAVSKKVVAVVGSFTTNGQAIVPLLERSKIPWFGGCCPTVEAEFTSKYSYPLGSGIGVIVGQAALAAKLPSCTEVGLVVLDIPSKPFIEKLVKNALKSSGKKLSKTVTLPVAVGGDLSPQVAELTSGPNCVVSGLATANWEALVPALKQSGTADDVVFMAASGNLTTELVEQLDSFSGGVYVSGIYPDQSLPAWSKYQAAVKDAKSELDYSTLYAQGAWAAYVAFTKIAAPLTDLSSATFADAANGASNVDTDGLTPAVDFTQEFTQVPGFNRVFNRSVSFSVAKDGKLVPHEDGAFMDLTAAIAGT